tara:strand:- start:2231 stop:3898 length:1668 start_codon:yes stop_codon:yes gene_type:complete
MAFDITTAKPENQNFDPSRLDINSPNFGQGAGFATNSGPVAIAPVTNSTGSGFDISTAKPEAKKTTIGEDILGGVEVLGTVVSSAIAEPISGLSGLISTAFGGLDSGVDTVKMVKDAITFEPRSEAGKAQLKAVGETLKPVGDALSATESFLGNSVLEATGSPELAAIAHSLPTAALELFGVKGLKGSKLKGERLSSNVGKAIQQASPAFNDIKIAKNAAYKELDNLGVKIKAETFDKFADNLTKKLNKEAIDQTVTPKSFAALQRIIDQKGTPKTLSEMDTIRKAARAAANDIDKSDARLGNIIISEIDDGLDNLSVEIGGKFKNARSLAQKGFKSQEMQDLIENASLQASGFENGLRIGARQLLKNKKRIKGFTADERAALRDLVEGDLASNTAKKLSRLGFGNGAATNHLGASSSIGVGGILGSVFGGPMGTAIGVITPPIIGKLAANAVEKLTLNKLKFADDLIKSGKNAKAVVRTYLKHTPITKRNVDDLTALLLNNDLNLSDIKSLPKSAEGTAKLIADAKFFAEEIKRRAKQGASAGLMVAPTQQQDK